MAYELPVQVVGTLPANADLSASQFFAVKLATGSKVALASVAGEQCYGILQNKPAADTRGAAVMTLGVSKVKLGGTVAVGDKLATTSAGKLVIARGSDYVVAIALEAGALDEIIAAQVLASAVVRAEGAQKCISIPVTLALLSAADVIGPFTPGFAGRIEKMAFVVTTVVTTGAKAATLTPKIGTTSVTGGVVALTSANCTPLGAEVAGTAVTGANVFTATDAIKVTGSAVTTFVEGAGVLLLWVS